LIWTAAKEILAVPNPANPLRYFHTDEIERRGFGKFGGNGHRRQPVVPLPIRSNILTGVTSGQLGFSEQRSL
jgi:hypothetical protein